MKKVFGHLPFSRKMMMTVKCIKPTSYVNFADRPPIQVCFSEICWAWYMGTWTGVRLIRGFTAIEAYLTL